MERKFSPNFAATLKRTAANVYPLLKKRAALAAKRDSIELEMNMLDEAIDLFEAPIRKQCHDYESSDLVDRIVGANGKSRFVLKYPETVLPPDDAGVYWDNGALPGVGKEKAGNADAVGEIDFTSK